MSESLTLEEDDAIVVEEGEIIPDLERLGISSGQEDEDSTTSISEEIKGSEIQNSATQLSSRDRESFDDTPPTQATAATNAWTGIPKGRGFKKRSLFPWP